MQTLKSEGVSVCAKEPTHSIIMYMFRVHMYDFDYERLGWVGIGGSLSNLNIIYKVFEYEEMESIWENDLFSMCVGLSMD